HLIVVFFIFPKVLKNQLIEYNEINWRFFCNIVRFFYYSPVNWIMFNLFFLKYKRLDKYHIISRSGSVRSIHLLVSKKNVAGYNSLGFKGRTQFLLNTLDSDKIQNILIAKSIIIHTHDRVLSTEMMTAHGHGLNTDSLIDVEKLTDDQRLSFMFYFSNFMPLKDMATLKFFEKIKELKRANYTINRNLDSYNRNII
ncbi:MAG: hypothetical protein Q8N88_00035, partial [Nanoarchaeota archaeon]|nr:hypothetical protein [Nanoarchaeota archaeon]